MPFSTQIDIIIPPHSNWIWEKTGRINNLRENSDQKKGIGLALSPISNSAKGLLLESSK